MIFGTNLLIEGPTPVFCFCLFQCFYRKGISNGIQTEWNLRDNLSWNESNPEDLEWTSRKQWGSHEAGGHAPGGGHAPHPRGPLAAPPTYFFRLYILLYPETFGQSHETPFPPPQPSVPVRSLLGAFSGDMPEGESIMEGFYINTMASPMMCE